jgi:hypothetical protein
MPKLPNAERAVVNIKKLREYSLNPGHDEGKHKARVFRSALNFTQEDAERLREIVLEAARSEEAVLGKRIRHGQLYTVDFATKGLRGSVSIRTAWIIAFDADFPRLVTCYVKGEPK